MYVVVSPAICLMLHTNERWYLSIRFNLNIHSKYDNFFKHMVCIVLLCVILLTNYLVKINIR